MSFRRCTGVGIAAIVFLLSACSTPAVNNEAASSKPEVAVQSKSVDSTAKRDKDERLVKALAQHYKKPTSQIQRIVAMAEKAAKENDFPRRNMILAIIAVESRFNPKASYLGSKGLMQIRVNSHRKELVGKNPLSIEDNISVGVGILRQYKELAKSDKLTIIAYNQGIGVIKRRHYSTAYYKSVKKELAYIDSIG